MSEQPAWIQMLFKRGHGLNAFHTRFLMDFHRHLVEEKVEGEPRGRSQLRSAALEALQAGEE